MISIEKNELRKFGLITGSIFIIMGVFPFLKGKHLNLPLIVIASLLVLLSIVTPNLLSPVYKVWMKIGKILGRINSFLILSIIFYLVITPVGFIYRIFKADSKKFTYKSGNSYWIKRLQGNPKEDMKRLF